MTSQAPVDSGTVKEKAEAEKASLQLGLERLAAKRVDAIAVATAEWRAKNWFQKHMAYADDEADFVDRARDEFDWYNRKEKSRRYASIRTCEGLIHLCDATGGDIMLSHEHAKFLEISEGKQQLLQE